MVLLGSLPQMKSRLGPHGYHAIMSSKGAKSKSSPDAEIVEDSGGRRVILTAAHSLIGSRGRLSHVADDMVPSAGTVLSADRGRIRGAGADRGCEEGQEVRVPALKYTENDVER